MTDAWERTCPFVELDSARLAELLRPVWGTCRVEQATLLTAGKCNTNYRVRGAGRDEPVVVRLVTREPAAAEREARKVLFGQRAR